MDTREDKGPYNPIQYDPTWLLNEGCIFGNNTNTTDGIYCPVDGSMKPLQMVFTWWPAIQAGACCSHQTSAGAILWHNTSTTSNKYVPRKYVIRLYILSIHTSWAGVVRFWYICPLLSRHSFAWKPPSSQPASEGNERRLMCVTSLLVFHRIRYYIPVTHAFVPQSYPLSVLHYQRVVLHLRYSIVQCTSHWNHTVLIVQNICVRPHIC